MAEASFETMTAPTSSIRGRTAGVVGRLAGLPPSIPALVLILVLALVLVPDFYSPTNLIGLAPQIAALAVLTMGQTLVLLGRGLDLAVSAVVGAAAVILSGALFHSLPERIAAAL